MAWEHPLWEKYGSLPRSFPDKYLPEGAIDDEVTEESQALTALWQEATETIQGRATVEGQEEVKELLDLLSDLSSDLQAEASVTGYKAGFIAGTVKALGTVKMYERLAA